MRSPSTSRRSFLGDTSRMVTAGWLALSLPWVASLTACATDDAADAETYAHLTAREARTMRAFAAHVIPPDEHSPGADELGAVRFIDRGLAMPRFADSAPVIHAGLADLDTRARARGAPAGFASLSGADQVAIIREIEQTPFFVAARLLVVTGMFADPSYGGNKGHVAWSMLGIDHRPSYAAPYGWYDAALGDVAASGMSRGSGSGR